VRQARLAAGLTQAELAGAEMTKALISHIEHGRVRPSLRTLGVIARRLGRDVHAFLDDADPQVRQKRVAADLLAAEANVAVRTLVACVVFAVAAAVLGVLGFAALLAMIAMQIVESGYSWPVALGCVFLTCALGSAALIFMLRGLTLQELFAASRGELRGKV